MTELISSLPTWWLDALKIAFIPTAIGWLTWKTRSAHIVGVRIWSAVFGRPKGDDPVISSWLDERTSLMHLRAVTGVHFRTNAIAHRLREWATQNDEEIGDIRRCKEYFDLEKPGIRGDGSKRWEIFVSFAGFALAAALAMTSAAATLSPRAWVSVRVNDATQLLLGETDVIVWVTGQHFGRTDCSTPAPAIPSPRESRPTPFEKQTICRWFADPNYQTLMRRELTQQRELLLGSAAFFAFYWWLSYGWFSSVIQTRYMMKRLAKKNSEVATDIDLDGNAPPQESVAIDQTDVSFSGATEKGSPSSSTHS